MTSTDGLTWTSIHVGATIHLKAAAYGSSKFAAVGSTGKILTSPDGTTWTPRTSGVTATLYGITFAANKFVAVGSSGTILTSPDGISWTKRTSGVTEILNAVAYTPPFAFVAVGNDMTILSSPDGINWTTRTTGTLSNDLYGVTYGNNSFVAVGSAGMIIQSHALAPLPPEGLKATSMTASRTDLRWTDTSSGETSFRVYRKRGASACDSIKTTSQNIQTYSDTSATENDSSMSHSYFVQVCNNYFCLSTGMLPSHSLRLASAQSRLPGRSIFPGQTTVLMRPDSNLYERRHMQLSRGFQAY